MMISDPNFPQLYATMETLRPEYNMQRYGMYGGLPDVKNYFVLYFVAALSCLIGSSSTVMMITFMKIRRYVQSVQTTMSPKSATMFNMMIKALVIQSCMPVLFSIPSTLLYYLMQFGSFKSLTAEYLIFFVSPMIVVIDPCVTMFYVLPYRNFILKKVRFGKSKESTQSIRIQPSSTLRS
uniref:7TM GPCR domain containing protein n=1 Tax=Haemonchus contortus TaxID=6289 RepID=A0A7I5E7P3_HAECO